MANATISTYQVDSILLLSGVVVNSVVADLEGVGRISTSTWREALKLTYLTYLPGYLCSTKPLFSLH